MWRGKQPLLVQWLLSKEAIQTTMLSGYKMAVTKRNLSTVIYCNSPLMFIDFGSIFLNGLNVKNQFQVLWLCSTAYWSAVYNSLTTSGRALLQCLSYTLLCSFMKEVFFQEHCLLGASKDSESPNSDQWTVHPCLWSPMNFVTWCHKHIWSYAPLSVHMR